MGDFMEDIIEKLYEAHLKTESFPFGKPNKEDMTEEWELYNLLYESLSPEQKKSFYVTWIYVVCDRVKSLKARMSADLKRR